MTATSQISAIDIAKLAAAIENTKRGLSFYRTAPDTTHLDDLLARLQAKAR